MFSRFSADGSNEEPKFEPKAVARKPKIYNQIRPMVSSAARINLSLANQIDFLVKMRAANRWQEDAWEYYDLVGEVKQAATLLANVTSRVRLYPGFVVDRDAVPSIIDDIKDIPDSVKEKANAAMMLLASGNGGIAGLLRDAALNLFIAGECFLIREPARPSKNEPEKWQIRSVSEFRKSIVDTPNGPVESMSIHPTKSNIESEIINLPPGTFVGRIWRSHPRYSLDPDSSMLGVLELLDELLLIDRQSRSTIRSRLNNGIFALPDELDQSQGTDGEADPEDPEYAEEIADVSHDIVTPIEEELMDELMEPIKDETSSSASMPVFFRAPGDRIEQIKHITFSRPYDTAILTRNERIMERILTALDLPKDVMAGFANLKYSNAIVIEESLYKAHVEPLTLMIVDSLTVMFLRPVLRGLGVPEDIVSRVTVWYDPSAITAKPDKASAATTGYEQNMVSAAAWRRENGFSETDGPTQLELAQKMAISKGLLSEPITEALLNTLIPEILGKVRDASMANTDPASAGALEQALDPNAPAPAAGDAPTELIEPGGAPAPTESETGSDPAPQGESLADAPTEVEDVLQAEVDQPEEEENPPSQLFNL